MAHYTRTCRQCGRVFTTAVRNHFICSAACRRDREAERTQRRYPIHLVTKTCPECGGQFTQFSMQRSKWCSRECKQKYRGRTYTESQRICSRRRRSTVSGRVNHNMRTSIYRCLRDRKGGSKWESLVGYTLADLMTHLEAQFDDGMSWDNYGEWHVDHITPQSWFTFDGPDDPAFHECWGLKNLQPLWAVVNRSKSNRFVA